MSYYFLKHEDKDIAFFEADENSVKNIKLSNKYTDYMPDGICDEEHVSKFIQNRGIPVTRQRIDIDLKLCKVNTCFEIMLKNNGLSLTDHYWICPRSDSYTWKSINLYTNQFKSVYSLDLRDDLCSITGKTNFIPSASLKGDLKKKWIIDNNNIRRLVKGNYNNSCRQSICEVLATEIHAKQNKFKFTPYGLIKITSDNQEIIGCHCPNFTDINTEFIPAYDIIDSYEKYISKKRNDMSYYELYIEICKKHGLDIRGFMEYQIMTDFIVSNSDRHFNNFGIIRDSNTLKWISPAPIFDTGNSMFYKSSYIPVDKSLLKLEVTSFLKYEIKHLQYVTNRGLIDLRLLPSDNQLYKLLNIDTNTREDANERLVRAYNKKIKYLNDFQNGADIWSYKYKG